MRVWAVVNPLIVSSILTDKKKLEVKSFLDGKKTFTIWKIQKFNKLWIFNTKYATKYKDFFRGEEIQLCFYVFTLLTFFWYLLYPFLFFLSTLPLIFYFKLLLSQILFIPKIPLYTCICHLIIISKCSFQNSVSNLCSRKYFSE